MENKADKPVSHLIGNLLDQWDGMANDTKGYLQELEEGFCNAVEALRPKGMESK